MKNMILGTLLTTGLMAAGWTAAAQSAGEEEYMHACSACHGEAAKGDGPLAELLTVEVPDLTRIAARNDGQFPLLEVIHIIDGRTGMRAHGSPMAVWGRRFTIEMPPETGQYGAEMEVRGRILALATYLESLQE